MLRILTDTGSDIAYLSAPDLGLEIVELGIQFEGLPYDFRNDTDFRVFYENLAKSKKLPTTSQVTPGQYLEMFEDAEAKGDEVLVITISGKLSGTHNAAVMAQEMSGYAGISVVDSQSCCISQRMLAMHAVKLRDEGKDRAAIAAELEALKVRLGFAVMLDTLEYLKKGGRVPPAMALIGSVLGMKPIVAMIDGKPESLAKARGWEAGKKALWKHFEDSNYDPAWPVYFGYSKDRAKGEAFMQETKEKYGLKGCQLYPVGGAIGTHAGPGGIAIGFVKK
ncbi:MAG: DegV family protein [Oscillospiraceae bacterium]|nr:DegV family protein [Oscillospiraceae bacterium]